MEAKLACSHSAAIFPDAFAKSSRLFPSLWRSAFPLPSPPRGFPRPEEPGLVTVPSKRSQGDELRSAEDVANAQPGERDGRQAGVLFSHSAACQKALRPNARPAPSDFFTRDRDRDSNLFPRLLAAPTLVARLAGESDAP